MGASNAAEALFFPRVRTYTGNSSMGATNALFRARAAELGAGEEIPTSFAFHLLTQNGIGSDDPRYRAEVGRIGGPFDHAGDLDLLYEGLDWGRLNPSYTINATANPVVAAHAIGLKKRGLDIRKHAGTTQGDVLKEILSRGSYIFGPEMSVRIMIDGIVWCANQMPKWNPSSVGGYHIREAGASAELEAAYLLLFADTIWTMARPLVSEEQFETVVAQTTGFCNSTPKVVLETTKFWWIARAWDQLAQKHGVKSPKARRCRFGGQVYSLESTERQAENNPTRNALALLGFVLGGARSVQIPGWNEAKGLPRAWDQFFAREIGAVLEHETDIMDLVRLLRAHPEVLNDKIEEFGERAQAIIDDTIEHGGLVSDSGISRFMGRIAFASAQRQRVIDDGKQRWVGVNHMVADPEDPDSLFAGRAGSGILLADQAEVDAHLARLADYKRGRSNSEVSRAMANLSRAWEQGENTMPATLDLMEVGGTIAEWTEALSTAAGITERYRGPTGVEQGTEAWAGHPRVLEFRSRIGGLCRLPVVEVLKPGLDGHGHGAARLAEVFMASGAQTIYHGIVNEPEESADRANEAGVDVVGMSILSGAHIDLVRRFMARRAEIGATFRVVVGGIIPEEDIPTLLAMGVEFVRTPKDKLLDCVDDVVGLLEAVVGKSTAGD